MTPAEYNKTFTVLLNDLIEDTEFSKKRVSCFKRRVGSCEQVFSFYFTRQRGLPGTLYSLTLTLQFSFTAVDQLICFFEGEKYDPAWNTIAVPMYTIVPGKAFDSYIYCSDNPLKPLAGIVAEDFRTYALPFYGRYDTLDKLEYYFARFYAGDYVEDRLSVVRGKRNRNELCYAAILCASEKWDTLWQFLDKNPTLSAEYRARIIEYAAGKIEAESDS